MKIRVPSQLWGQCGFFFKHSLSLCSLLLAISAYSLEVGYTYSYSSSKSAWSAPGDETTLTSGHFYDDTNHGLWGSWFGVLALEQPHPGPLGWPRREGGEGRRWQELSSFQWFSSAKPWPSFYLLASTGSGDAMKSFFLFSVKTLGPISVYICSKQ